MAEMGFYIDMTSCIGCHTCQIACKDAKSLEVGTLFRRVDSYETGSFPTPGWYHYSHTCNHCESPACVDACLMRCIEWGEVEKLKAAHPDAVNKIACMPDSDTEPSTLITPTAAALKDEFRLRVI